MGSGGGEWEDLDSITNTRMNQKTLYISASAPSTTYAGMVWYDSTNNILYQRNGANSAWINRNDASSITSGTIDVSRLPSVGRVPITIDDSTVTQTGTTETEKKYARFIKTENIVMNTLRVLASLNTNNASGTAYLKVYIDAEGTARLTLNTTSTSEVAVEGTFSISDLSAGIHTVRIKIYNGNASYITTNNILEVIME
jgi:hypothetical protein